MDILMGNLTVSPKLVIRACWDIVISPGTCVQIRIAPYSADPDWNDFKILDLCLPYHNHQKTSAIVVIPETYSGKYVIHWMWKFGPFYFATCADIAVTNAHAAGSVMMETTRKPVTQPAVPVVTRKPTKSAPGVMELYKQYGCAALANPGEFCYEYYGTYCKVSAGADYCGRHICHKSTHSELDPCMRLRR